MNQSATIGAIQDLQKYFSAVGNAVNTLNNRLENLERRIVLSEEGEATKVLNARIDDLLQRVEMVAELFVTKLEVVQAERDKARADYQFMVDRACNEKLDGYRELGARAAAAENRADTREREVGQLLQRLATVAQILIDEVGAEGPLDAEDAAHKAVQIIRELRAKGG
jgi:hypothetical protein